MRVALVGNQNCGKTTLFNALTGGRQRVGNFPGVTVEKKEGRLKGASHIIITDLPGIYSLTPYSEEERVTREFLLRERPDLILNIADAVNPERSLYLTLQLTELGIPMILAFNLMDEVKTSGGSLNCEEIRRKLGIPVMPVSALKGEGMSRLREELIRGGERPRRLSVGDEKWDAARSRLRSVVEKRAEAAGWPPDFAAGRLLEGDDETARALKLSGEEQQRTEQILRRLEQEEGLDQEALAADRRYRFIEALCRRCVVRPPRNPGRSRSQAIDRLLTHRYLGLPLFFLIMGGAFWLSFQGIGAWLRKGLAEGLSLGTIEIGRLLKYLKAAPWLQSLVTDGICAGVGSVLSFLPVILVLFFLLSLMEDSGYMARGAFMMDRLLGRIGLSGRSFVPLLLGFGCSVPAILSARTLSSERDRRLTILLIPFISCSAKLPIYGLLGQTFFPERAGWLTLGMYGLGILMLILVGGLMGHTRYRGTELPFVMEMPEYRLPSPANLLLHVGQRAGDFFRKAFTTILLASAAVWFLGHFDSRLQFTAVGEESLLAGLGSLLAPAFRPLGFGDWRAAAALVTGLTAKEAVVSTLTVLTGASTPMQLQAALRQMLTPAAALSFSCFAALYMPCAAAFAAAKRELGSLRLVLENSLIQTGAAYGAAILVYFTASRLM